MVCVLLSPGFEESEAIVPVDLLRRAGIEVALTSLEEEYVTSSHGITVKVDMTLAQLDISTVELVFLPGGLNAVRTMTHDTRVPLLARRVLDLGGYVAAICAAPTLLAHWGFLEGTRAVCYPGMEAEMEGALLQPSVPYAVDGHIITGEAAGAAFPFGLKLLELLRGAETAQEVRNAVHYHG